MRSPNYPSFDRRSLRLKPLKDREHLLDRSVLLPLQTVEPVHDALSQVADRLRVARRRGASRVLMMGAHVIRSGVQRYLIDLMKKKYISCIAMNGAGVIHDYEFALIGATTESVSKYIQEGQFGLWEETGRINEIVRQAKEEGLGLGEAMGRAIEENLFPYRGSSLLASAYRSGCLVTVHVGIGSDILHEHPNCDGAAYGQTSYMDFLRFAGALESLEGGVLMNFGSAVMAPEVYLKALAMVRNAAHQKGQRISCFTTLVCDLLRLPSNFHQEASRDTPEYYFRPWKTMLVRTVADGGESFYVRGMHRETIPQLWTALCG